MRFTVVIDDTDNGTLIARQLRAYAAAVDNSIVSLKFRQAGKVAHGFADMVGGPVKYSGCAEAERLLRRTLEWRLVGQTYHGTNSHGDLIAVVDKAPKLKPVLSPMKELPRVVKPNTQRRPSFSYETYEYDCGNPCTTDGCKGHGTNLPINIELFGEIFDVAGYKNGDFPDNDPQHNDNVKYAVSQIAAMAQVYSAFLDAVESTTTTVVFASPIEPLKEVDRDKIITAACWLLLAATGPNGGPTSWKDTRNQLLEIVWNAGLLAMDLRKLLSPEEPEDE